MRFLSPIVFVLSLVVASAGFGLAVPHLTKEGMTWTTVLGIVLLVAGVVVAGWAAHRMLRGVRRRWLFLAVPLMLVVTYLGLWTVGQGVAAAYPARPDLGSRTPSDAGLTSQEVSMRTSDDVDLTGWWVPSGNGAAVVVLHGAGSTRTAVLDHAAVLADHGYGVLLVDARGHGDSDGRGMDFGWYGERDMAAAVDFLVAQPGIEPQGIALLGLSMGGEEAIGAAGVDARVSAVVAEGATNRVAADKGFLSAAYGIRGDIQRVIDWGTYSVAGLLSDAPEPEPLREAVVATQTDGTPTPLLLITAGEVETERLAADYIADAAPESVEVWTVPGAAHTRGLRTNPDEWARRVLAFLDDALSGQR